MTSLFPWLYLVVVALAITSLIRVNLMPVLVPVAVLILGIIGALAGFH